MKKLFMILALCSTMPAFAATTIVSNDVEGTLIVNIPAIRNGEMIIVDTHVTALSCVGSQSCDYHHARGLVVDLVDRDGNVIRNPHAFQYLGFYYGFTVENPTQLFVLVADSGLSGRAIRLKVAWDKNESAPLIAGEKFSVSINARRVKKSE